MTPVDDFQQLIGSSSADEDFEKGSASANVARDVSHSHVSIVLAACSQLQNRATQFVLESFGSQAFGKALDCIKAMRSAAIKVRTSSHFKCF